MSRRPPIRRLYFKHFLIPKNHAMSFFSSKVEDFPHFSSFVRICHKGRNSKENEMRGGGLRTEIRAIARVLMGRCNDRLISTIPTSRGCKVRKRLQMTTAVGGGRVYPKSRQKEGRLRDLSDKMGRGERGLKKSYVEVICGWSLELFMATS